MIKKWKFDIKSGRDLRKTWAKLVTSLFLRAAGESWCPVDSRVSLRMIRKACFNEKLKNARLPTLAVATMSPAADFI